MAGKPPESFADRIAIALSGLCILHCLALPVLLLLVPILDETSVEHFHVQALVFVLPVSVYALLRGYRWHRRRVLLVTGLIGIGLLLAGALWAHNYLGIVADRLLTVCGSMVLAVTHYMNSRLARRHRVASNAG